MEYYCQRFGFGKPDVMFETASVKTKKNGPSTQQWEAVITVGGRRIGQGAGTSKKTAQVKCYLDVTQYLESCDPDLWRNFVEASKKDNSGNLGQAPHILFQMSDDLTDEIGDLCRDVKGSTLYARRPPTGSISQEVAPETQHHRVPTQPPSDDYIVTKSASLQNKLASYQADESLAAMRAQRESLPIFTKASGILAKIEVNDVTIVMAATGSGKTTQVPQLLFDDWINRGEGAKCNIICTQPRRLAATSVAERVAEERGDVLGNEVGYQVRFDTKLPQPHGSITFCTTGIFLKRMQSALGQGGSARDAMDLITHIVVDEVHERDIDTDLLLVVLKRLLADRKTRGKPLKIILMSATVDPTLFQSYFADARGRLAPIAEVPGRTFPVERHHLEDIVEDMRGHGLPANQGGWVFSEKDVDAYLRKELSGDAQAFVGNSGELPVPYALVALTIAHVLNQSDDGRKSNARSR
jgi:small subunit ribosomal protein S24e